jgi:hypothetical protein
MITLSSERSGVFSWLKRDGFGRGKKAANCVALLLFFRGDAATARC